MHRAVLSAVDLDPRLEPALLAQAAQRPDLRQHFGQERLPAETGIDRHQQNEIDAIQHMLDGTGGR